MDEESGDLATKIQRQLVLGTTPQKASPTVDTCSIELDSLHLSQRVLKRSLSAPNLAPNSSSPSLETESINRTLSNNFQEKCGISNLGNDSPYLYNIDLPNRRWYNDEPMEEELIFLMTNFHVEDSKNPYMPYIC
jgi:hypothetical protein